MRKTLLALGSAAALTFIALPAQAVQPPAPFVEVMGPVHMKDGPSVQVRWLCPAGELSSLSINLSQDIPNHGWYLDQTDFFCTGKVQALTAPISQVDDAAPTLHKGDALISVDIVGFATTTKTIKVV